LSIVLPIAPLPLASILRLTSLNNCPHGCKWYRPSVSCLVKDKNIFNPSELAYRDCNSYAEVSVVINHLFQLLKSFIKRAKCSKITTNSTFKKTDETYQLEMLTWPRIKTNGSSNFQIDFIIFSFTRRESDLKQ